MSLTPSTMIPLGTKLPEFSLPDVTDGKTVSSDDISGKKASLVIFLSRHCPYVQHVKHELARLDKEYGAQDVWIAGISSNDAENHPEDAPDSLKEFVEEEGFSFPILYDETQEVAKKFTAACTPDVFLFDKEGKLVYRGQLDESRPGNGKPATGEDIRSALDAVLAGKPVFSDQRPSTGCNIKWKPGQEPEYFR